jgi:hypothetical protein
MGRMRTSWVCVVRGHGWRQQAGEPGGVSRQCDRCGRQERVDWVYMGPGTGLGRVRTVPAQAPADELLVA